MYSENDTRHFFQLLRSGLKPDCTPAVTGKISARQWDDIFRMAADQGVCAVIGDGMERLPEKLRPPRDIRLRWALTAERQEKRYRRQQDKTAKMAAAFAENGIRMLVLKGLGLSRDYPVPAHRECGDIDIYLFGASDEGDRLLLQMGAQPYFDVPKHSSHTWDGILIENHRTIVRHLIKPGITGWAQVTGYRGETHELSQMEGRVRRDIWYLENWSLLLDIRIMLLTVWNALKRDENAY